jgi:hypothetical protein
MEKKKKKTKQVGDEIKSKGGGKWLGRRCWESDHATSTFFDYKVAMSTLERFHELPVAKDQRMDKYADRACSR